MKFRHQLASLLLLIPAALLLPTVTAGAQDSGDGQEPVEEPREPVDPRKMTSRGTGEGVASCNCGDMDITGANIPHLGTTQVTLTDGTDAGGQGTDLSGTAYSGQTIAPGKCKYVKYVFSCCKTGTLWVCTSQSFSLEERDTTEDDCDD